MQTDSLDMSLLRRYDLLERDSSHSDHDYSDIPNCSSLSPYKDFVIGYIAGYVVRMTKKQIHCPVCVASLTLQGNDSASDNRLEFLLFTDHGGLVKPSESVVTVCQKTEQCIQRMLSCTGGILRQASHDLVECICLAVLSYIGSIIVFHYLNDHMFESTPDSNHVFNLIKVLAQNFAKIRMHSLSKKFSVQISGVKIRKKIN